MAPLKDKKKKRKAPKRMPKKAMGMAPVYKTGMNRDIPMGGAGGSGNLMANLLSSRAQAPAAAIQTPDQFKLAQDIKSIKLEQANIAEEQQAQKRRANYGLTREENRIRKEAEDRAAEAAKEERRRMAEEKYGKKAPSNLKEAAGGEEPKEVKTKASRAASKKAAEDIIASIPLPGVDMPANPDAEVSQPFNVEPNAFPMSGRGLRRDAPGKLGEGYADYSHSLAGKDEI